MKKPNISLSKDLTLITNPENPLESALSPNRDQKSPTNTLTHSPNLKLLNSSLDRGKNLSIKKKQNLIRLKKNHNLLRTIAKIDNEEYNSRDNSSLNTSFKSMSLGLRIVREGQSTKKSVFNKFADVMMDMNANLAKKTQNEVKGALPKCLNKEAENWMKNHGVVKNFGIKGFKKYLKELFKILDVEDSSYLNIKELIALLLGLELVPGFYYAEKAIQILFRVPNLNKARITLENFSETLTKNSKLDYLMNKLNFYASEKKSYEKKYFSKPQEESILEAEFNFEKAYCDTSDILDLLKDWWTQLDPDHDYVPLRKISEFLLAKGLFSNKNEFTQEVRNYTKGSYLKYSQFEMIFLKPMFKLCLVNIQQTLASTKDYQKMPLYILLANWQRKCMVKDTIPQNKGSRSALNSVNNYLQKLKSEGIDHFYYTTTPEAHEERLKKLLFNVEEEAGLFLNEKGEIKKEVKNIWEVKKKLNMQLMESNPRFKDQVYLDSILGNQKLPEIKLRSPMTKKVRIFRDNYLLGNLTKD